MYKYDIEVKDIHHNTTWFYTGTNFTGNGLDIHGNIINGDIIKDISTTGSDGGLGYGTIVFDRPVIKIEVENINYNTIYKYSAIINDRYSTEYIIDPNYGSKFYIDVLSPDDFISLVISNNKYYTYKNNEFIEVQPTLDNFLDNKIHLPDLTTPTDKVVLSMNDKGVLGDGKVYSKTINFNELESKYKDIFNIRTKIK